MIACDNSNQDINNHFVEVNKMVDIGSKTKREVVDYKLTRYACYLIVQNGAPRKEVIALGQIYFAVQTYRQEINDKFEELDEDRRRLVIRGDIKKWNQLLVDSAHDIGIITKVRKAIKDIGGTMPEDLPTPKKSIKKIEKNI